MKTIPDILLFMMDIEDFSAHIVLKSGQLSNGNYYAHALYTTAAVMFDISIEMIWGGDYYG